MRYSKILVLLLVGLFYGCASNPMLVAQNQAIEPPAANESQVVFLRSSFLGAAINASLYEVTEDATKYIGIISNGVKIAYKTAPGKRRFMVVSEAADFMEAELLPGKTYYSVVTPRMGTWKARFSLWPVRGDGTSKFNTTNNEFKSLMSNTKLMQESPKSNQWFENNKNSVEAKKVKYLPVWDQKSPEDVAQRTLNPQDGV